MKKDNDTINDVLPLLPWPFNKITKQNIDDILNLMVGSVIMSNRFSHGLSPTFRCFSQWPNQV